MTVKRKCLYTLSAAAVGITCVTQTQAATILTDLTTGGTAFASGGSLFNDGPVANAFDNNSATKVGMDINASTTTPAIVGYTFAQSVADTVLSYSLTSANDDDGRDPRDFTLQGSLDAATWTILDTRSNILFTDTDGVSGNRFETIFFTVQTPGSYSSYRVVTTETRDASWNTFQFAELQLFATVIPEPGTFGLLAASSLLLLGRRRRSN